MGTYISMLRGINVGGTKKILMKDLAALYESCGFTKIQTYVQSGNVVFDSREKKPAAISKTIEAGIEKKYKFHAGVIVRTPQDFEKVIAGNPFLRERDIDTRSLYVTFLSDAPDGLGLQNVADAKSGADQFEIRGREIFVFCPDGYGTTKLTNNFFESKLKRAATTRNWNTVTTLYEMAVRKP
jgi:uncharacterized protein (DUF1697 family)